MSIVFLLLISGCANTFESIEKETENSNEIIAVNDPWPTLTDKEIQDAKIVVEEYYKNNNSIIFFIHTKDVDKYAQLRIIVLTRENKDSNWQVVNEGL